MEAPYSLACVTATLADTDQPISAECMKRLSSLLTIGSTKPPFSTYVVSTNSSKIHMKTQIERIMKKEAVQKKQFLLLIQDEEDQWSYCDIVHKESSDGNTASFFIPLIADKNRYRSNVMEEVMYYMRQYMEYSAKICEQKDLRLLFTGKDTDRDTGSHMLFELLVEKETVNVFYYLLRHYSLYELYLTLPSARQRLLLIYTVWWYFHNTGTEAVAKRNVSRVKRLSETVDVTEGLKRETAPCSILDPVYGTLMHHPVICSDFQTYDFKNLTQINKKRAHEGGNILMPIAFNEALYNIIEEWLSREQKRQKRNRPSKQSSQTVTNTTTTATSQCKRQRLSRASLSCLGSRASGVSSAASEGVPGAWTRAHGHK